MQWFNYIQRLIATGLLFVFFGIGGLIISFFAYPILYVLVRNPTKRSQCGQYFIHICFRLFTYLLKLFGICTIDIQGRHLLQKKGMFIITNHPTLIDVVILMSLLPQTDCVVKAKLTENLFTRGPLKMAAYIINSSGEQLIESCISTLNKHHNLIMFPEGTRTQDSNKLHFKRGAAKIAIKAQKNITPVSIICKPRMLAKGQKWYKIPHNKPHYIIEVGKEILIKNFLDTEKSENIQSRNLNNYLVKYFKEELQIA